MIRPCGKYYVTTEDMEYRGVIVPKGFRTDGISYKFRLVGVFINKFDPLYIEAVIFHDYLTDLGDWDTANRVFEELLPDTRVAKVMVVAVKLYGKFVRGGR
jgi:hypothetical protein